MNPSFVHLLQDVFSHPFDQDELLAQRLRKALYEYESSLGFHQDPHDIASLMQQVFSVSLDTTPSISYLSPWMALNEVTEGFSEGELVVVGGRPGMGKTTFLLNLALKFSQSSGISEHIQQSLQEKLGMVVSESAPVLFYTLESSKKKCALLSFKIIKERVHSDHSNPNDLMRGYKFYIKDEIFNSMSSFKLDVEEHVKNYGIKIVVIDYLQMMNTAKRNYNRAQEIAHMVNILRQMSRDLNITIIVGSQLSRAVESRGGEKRPQLSDLRDSGEIEQLADKVLLLYRPEYYGFSEDAEGFSTENVLDVEIAKNRSGSQGTVRLAWKKDEFCIRDYQPVKSEWDTSHDRWSELWMI
jgi:replicative DNA helicase